MDFITNSFGILLESLKINDFQSKDNKQKIIVNNEADFLFNSLQKLFNEQ